jgi:hypothetical protein
MAASNLSLCKDWAFRSVHHRSFSYDLKNGGLTAAMNTFINLHHYGLDYKA